jgi:NAD(P)H-hydrate epimerase
MAEADRLTVAAGIPLNDLMQRAGQAVADVIVARYTPRPTLVLCGPGNNGGDGFVVARILAAGRWPVRVALLGDVSELKGAAADAAANWPGPIEQISDSLLKGPALIVDALFGAGLNRPLEGAVAQLIDAINLAEIDTVSIDIPSGVSGATGEVRGTAFQAAVTVTFFRKKPGHVLLPGVTQCGEVVLTDIGIAESVLPVIRPNAWENAPGLWLKRFPWPRGDTNKYVRGHALVVGGEMTGAGRLAAHAAQRIGAGLVTVACPPDSQEVYSIMSPSLIVHVVEKAEEISDIIEKRKVKAVLVGPGGGVGEALAFVIDAVIDCGLPAVFDADALTVLGQDKALMKRLNASHVLTPHEGEFKRLFDLDGSKFDRAKAAAKSCGATVLLKGLDTVIAAPDGKVAVNTNATSWLATAGSGDTLAGFITGLLAQGCSAFDAACIGAWIHAECGSSFGPGLIADDLAGQVPGVLRGLLGQV